jgi:hypothetical protein
MEGQRAQEQPVNTLKPGDATGDAQRQRQHREHHQKPGSSAASGEFHHSWRKASWD